MNAPPAHRGTVLQVTSMESHKYGGLEQYFVHLARACRSRGYRSVFQFERRPASEAYIQDLAGEDAAIAVCRTTGPFPLSIVNVLSVLRAHRPLIVQTHFVTGYGLLAVACFARALGARRVIALEHNPLDGVRTWHRRLAYRQFDHVLGVSEPVCRSILGAGVPDDRVSTHYLGVLGLRETDPRDRARFRRSAGIPEQAIVLGSLGYDTPRKGFEVLLAALRELRDDPREIHAMIIGVDQRSELSSRAESLGLQGRVHFMGIQDEGWRMLQAVDCYVQPSLSEGLPLGIMEAMALRLPVVATRVGGIPEAVLDGATGLLVEPRSVTGLVQALRRAVSDPARLKEMGDAGYSRYLDLFQGERSVEALVARYFTFPGPSASRPCEGPRRRTS